MPIPAQRPLTRTDAIRQAILRELARRASLIDDAHNLVSVTITVKLQDALDPIRSVVFEDQSVRSQRR